jgi:hypothetical protein
VSGDSVGVAFCVLSPLFDPAPVVDGAAKELVYGLFCALSPAPVPEFVVDGASRWLGIRRLY